MARTSLTEQLVDLRGRYTGENPSQATPAIRPVVADLGDVRRNALVDALRADSGHRPVLPPELRRALFPEATSVAQQELELGLLRAVSSSASHLQLGSGDGRERPTQLLRSVELERAPFHTLTLHPHEVALGPLLLELLPRVVFDELNGVPGLRHRQFDRCVELYLVDTEPAARVVLAGVGRRAWHAATTFADLWLRERHTPARWIGLDQPGELTSLERSRIAAEGRVPGPAALGSAVFRRSLLLGRAGWLTAWAQGAKLIVEWPAGPSLVEVADLLAHPVFGLPEAFEQLDAGPDSISFVELDGVGELFLRTVQAPTQSFSDSLNQFRWRPEYTAWRAWEDLMFGGRAGD
ncbi:hypothetical protein F0L68_30970 [Solihabitans fulvus]|uniref:Uncharacterized protein n=1 Tax=Solihabitans fulvus TaxID=1892852 RepID=A0A5B2WSV3_9PSEU|nr:hypothetical protein [Solihabitans fulvus]KAA2254038.1 hypothetical protein F0L68_30970 [Solihabitans fulvus]